MANFKKIDMEDNLAQMFLLCTGMYVLITGCFLLFIGEVESISKTYLLLSSLMSINMWAMLFTLSGLVVIVAAFTKKKVKFWMMAIGGFIAGCLLIFYAMASIEASSNLLLGIRYSVVACFSYAISTLGVRELWIRKTKKDY